MVGLDLVDPLSQGCERGLQSFRLTVVILVYKITEWIRTYSFKICRASRLSRSKSADSRRGLIALASSGGYSSLRSSISTLSLGMIIDPLGFLGPILGRNDQRSDRLVVRLTRPPSDSDPEEAEDELEDRCSDKGKVKSSTVEGIVGVVSMVWFSPLAMAP